MITLPKTSLNVYPLCLGGNVFGFSADVKNSEAVLDYYFDNGGNFVDTADMYSQWAPGHVGGESETIIGNWMKRRANRSKMIIASKVAKLDTRPGLKPANIIAACDDSLRRLQTDYIDLYYAHQDDPDTPIEETVWAMHDIVTQGKALYWGTSEWSAEEIARAYEIAERHHLHKPVAEQPQYNLFARARVEGEYRRILDELGIGLTTWSPLASGLLSGKYQGGIPSDSRAALPGFEWIRDRITADKLAVVDALLPIARDLSCSVSQLAIAWCLRNRAVSTVLLGATREEQLIENLGALVVLPQLTDEVMVAIADAVGDTK